jgi:hypothetical protein
MEKWKHTYTYKVGNIYPQTVSFKLRVGNKTFGHYEEYIPESKYRMLRLLVHTKHSIISALYEELDIYTRIANLSPTSENSSKVKELTDAILLKRKGF